MTTVANQPVGADSLSSKTMSSGKKSNVGNTSCFLGSGNKPGLVGGAFAGTMGGAAGPGSGGLPGSGQDVAVLTSIESKKKAG